MTLGTHVAFASVLYLDGATRFGYQPDGICRLLAAAASLLPVAARLIQGEPLGVVAERVAMQGHTLRWLVSRIDQSRPYYLLGEVEIADGRGPALTGRLDSVDTYHPASYRGGILRLHDARAAELGPWLDQIAVRGEAAVCWGRGRNGRWSGYRSSCGGLFLRLLASGTSKIHLLFNRLAGFIDEQLYMINQ